MLEALKERVCKENKRLYSSALVISTWGNVSARAEDKVIIKPSGLSYEEMCPEDMVVVDLWGNVLEGKRKPSSDLMTHLELYRHGKELGGIVHTHSTYATIWAQLGRSILPFGTTHGDDFYGEIPCTRDLTTEEIQQDYEKNTGTVILETLRQGKDLSPETFQKIPAVLVKQHGPFLWEESPEKAVIKAMVLEEVAKMAWHCVVAGGGSPMAQPLQDKHFERKHGKNAYYGQSKEGNT